MKKIQKKRSCVVSKRAKSVSSKKKKINFKKKLRKKIQQILVKHLYWSESIAKFVACVVCALLSTTGVWHKRIAQVMEGNTLVESNERRLQRFLCNFVINYHCFAVMLYQLLGKPNKLTIILDRTNWDYGKSHINIFVAAAVYQPFGMSQGFAVPLLWEVFSKKGNSNTAERKQLMKRLFAAVGKENIEVVLADREFIGAEWLTFLCECGISFAIRIKKNMFVKYQGQMIKASELFASTMKDEHSVFNVELDRIPVQLAATRSREGELVIVAASMGISRDALDQYKTRWLIELFFKSIKTKGFNIEETHMVDPMRIKSLFALVALASICAVLIGTIRHHLKKIPIKNHGRPTFSLFTYGLDFIRILFRGVFPSFSIKKCTLESLPDNLKILYISDSVKPNNYLYLRA